MTCMNSMYNIFNVISPSMFDGQLVVRVKRTSYEPVVVVECHVVARALRRHGGAGVCRLNKCASRKGLHQFVRRWLPRNDRLHSPPLLAQDDVESANFGQGWW